MSENHSIGNADPESFFTDYYPRIHRYVLSMVHDPAEADDLTQETFLRAHRSYSSLQDAGALATWLYRVATNVCHDRWRQRARRAPLEDESTPEELDLPDSDACSVQQTAEQGEMSACVQRYLERLPDSYRAVILLHDVNGLTGPEISEALGESLATIKIRLHRARRKLQAALQSGCAFSHDERNVLVCESKD